MIAVDHLVKAMFLLHLLEPCRTFPSPVRKSVILVRNVVALLSLVFLIF